MTICPTLSSLLSLFPLGPPRKKASLPWVAVVPEMFPSQQRAI